MLTVVGGLYAFSALAVLGYFVADQWLVSASMFDRMLQFALLLSAACGVWFVVIGLENLGWRHHSGTSKPASVHR
ncbi:MAG TPA: hypothetical protein VEK11_11690 [Thermoanaerobaculia bacterium]|nr:hypothetical protein [Thermoanaerobaculia bacterium]